MAVIDIEYGKAILADSTPGESATQEAQSLLEMEMILQNSSYGHEYARLELEGAADYLEQEALTRKMEDYKRAYFLARRYLKRANPNRLEALETELFKQKATVFNHYTA